MAGLRVSLALLCALVIGLAAMPAKATVIEFSTTDLGGGSWQYSYTVSGHSFDAFSGFDVYFDPMLYSNLDFAPAAPNPDWFAFTVQPDPVFPADGVYTAEALVDNASLADRFIISFTFLGAGAPPGSQPFDVFDSSFVVTEAGRSVPEGAVVTPVPEPGSALLLGSGLIGLFRLRRFRRQND